MRVCSILGLSAIYEPNWVTLQVSLLPVLAAECASDYVYNQ